MTSGVLLITVMDGVFRKRILKNKHDRDKALKKSYLVTLLCCSFTLVCLLETLQAAGSNNLPDIDQSQAPLDGFGNRGHHGYSPSRPAQTQSKEVDDGPQLVQRFLQKYDLNGDGRIERVEFFAAWMMRFSQFDIQHTGKISAQIFKEHLLPQQQELAERWFAAFDTNRDGSISKEEFEAAGKRLFERLDNDATGILTKEKLLLGLSPRDAANF